MKKLQLIALVSLAIAMTAGSAVATLITDDPAQIDVGYVDNIVSETDTDGLLSYGTGNGDEVINAWVSDELGSSYILSLKDEDFGTDYVEWISVTDSDDLSNHSIFTHQLTTLPDYYVIKTGDVATDDNRYFLFENYSSFEWAVIDLQLMDFAQIEDIQGVSFLSEMNSPVPEPATMFLFGTGLIGLVGTRIRKKKQQ